MELELNYISPHRAFPGGYRRTMHHTPKSIGISPDTYATSEKCIAIALNYAAEIGAAIARMAAKGKTASREEAIQEAQAAANLAPSRRRSNQARHPPARHRLLCRPKLGAKPQPSHHAGVIHLTMRNPDVL